MRSKAAWMLLPLLVLAGCDEYQVAEKSKEVVISKEEYEKLKAEAAQVETLRAEAALAKQVGRYQLHREGFRTWRLDTATGHNCLLLTTEADWKKPITLAQPLCDQEDAVEPK